MAWWSFDWLAAREWRTARRSSYGAGEEGMMAAAPEGGGRQRWPHLLRGVEKTRVGGTWDPQMEKDFEGLWEWRLGGGIWRVMQNGGSFRGSAGVEFLHLTSKFWNGGPHWSCLLVGIGPEGWTPTQQPPEFSPSLRLLPRGCYFYLRKEGKC
jgi:hypothetical protein